MVSVLGGIVISCNTVIWWIGLIFLFSILITTIFSVLEYTFVILKVKFKMVYFSKSNLRIHKSLKSATYTIVADIMYSINSCKKYVINSFQQWFPLVFLIKSINVDTYVNFVSDKEGKTHWIFAQNKFRINTYVLDVSWYLFASYMDYQYKYTYKFCIRKNKMLTEL